MLSILRDEPEAVQNLLEHLQLFRRFVVHPDHTGRAFREDQDHPYYIR